MNWLQKTAQKYGDYATLFMLMHKYFKGFAFEIPPQGGTVFVYNRVNINKVKQILQENGVQATVTYLG
jgi:hypothetical protein